MFQGIVRYAGVSLSSAKRHNPDVGIPMKTIENMLQALRKVRDDYYNGGCDFDCCMGICSNVNRALYKLDLHEVCPSSELRTLFETWPKYSGDVDYPVPSPSKDWSAAKQYGMVADMWAGEYGELRLELLNHCISELEKLCV